MALQRRQQEFTVPAHSFQSDPTIIPRPEHNISRSLISSAALKVLYRLHEEGFQAYLVGGGVRDLLLGRQPKDFDVATDATPEEVHALFRNSRVIGRRFRLVHVRFGQEIIEVSTFRAMAGEDDHPGHYVDESGRILRDNVFGSMQEDAFRRDFTVNALYYNIADFSVWDYVGGVEDIAARRLRLIGDPETRYREDPVRMLRAARFEAKLGFTVDEATAEPIPRLKGLLAAVPAARLFDETLKLFLTGHGARSLEVLRRRGLLETLLPTVAAYLDAHPGSLVEKLVMQGLRNTDSRVLEGKPVTPTFLFAVLLYGPIAQAIESAPPERWHEQATILDACDRASREAQVHIAIPRRFTLGVREMIALQPRLEHPRGRRALRLLEHPRFRAAYDLLLLRAEQGLAPAEMAQWWTRIQEVSAEERVRMADELAGQKSRPEAPRKRRRRRRRRPSNPT